MILLFTLNFCLSPGNYLDEVIDEINRTIADSKGVKLDVV
jgi:hypothetical protein